MKTIITAIFDDLGNAARAFEELTARGVDRDRISIVLANSSDDPGPDEELGKKLVEGPQLRSERGARLGAIVGASGLALGATALAIPGVLAIGPLAALLFGAGAGAVSGGFLGSLIGIGVTRDLAEVYHRSLEGGAAMLGVEVDAERREEIDQLLEKHGARGSTEVDYGD